MIYVFLKKLRDIVQPIRDKMSCHKNEFNAEFSPESHINSVPLILLTLTSMLINGTSVENKGFSQGTLYHRL